jgi:anti-sigma regulatory factor (Ser/Thr protein kinase)
MKTPLTCLAGAVSLLETTALNDEQLELIATLNFCSKTLNILINNILDYGKINEEQFFLEPVEFDLRHLLKETMSLVGLQAQSKEIDLRVEFDRRLEEQNLYADEFRIKQIILNLLTNAIKFTGKGGFVDLAVGLVEEPEASFIKFTIKDNGIGIQKQKQRQVFQPFSQFHSKKYGGSGLGLAISKKLVEKMGGCIWFESQENVGSVFAFTIRQNRQFLQKSDTFRPKTTYPVSFILTRNRGMSLYLEGVLKRASVTLNVVPVADEAELFRNITEWDGNKNEILVIEEMVNPDDRAQKAISELIMQGLRWVRIRCPGSSKQLLPCIRNKITKPFISNDLVQLILDPPMSQVLPKIVDNNISIMGSKDRCNQENLRILLVDDNATILSASLNFRFSSNLIDICRFLERCFQSLDTSMSKCAGMEGMQLIYWRIWQRTESRAII